MKHMIDDVLSVVCETSEITGLVVITDDKDVRAQALKYNARILAEPVSIPLKGADFQSEDASAAFRGVERLNRIFAMAMSKLAEEGEEGVLLLPADVPLVTVDNLKEMLAQHVNPGVTIVPASADGGTNAMMVSPPQLINPGFGELSCQRHCEFSRANGIEPEVLCFLELGLDIDTVDDLRGLMSTPPRSRTQRFLLESDIMKQIECLDERLLDHDRLDYESLGRESLAQDGREIG